MPIFEFASHWKEDGRSFDVFAAMELECIMNHPNDIEAIDKIAEWQGLWGVIDEWEDEYFENELE